MTRQSLMTGALANQTHFYANRKKNAAEKERAKELRKIIIDLAFQHSSSPDASQIYRCEHVATRLRNMYFQGIILSLSPTITLDNSLKIMHAMIINVCICVSELPGIQLVIWYTIYPMLTSHLKCRCIYRDLN